MKISSFKKLLFIFLLIYVPLQSMAWGMLGHRIIGQIAESYLTAKAHREVQKILGEESIALTSNWPDFIKSDPAYKYLNNWHYIDFEGTLSYEQMVAQLQKDTATNAYTKTNFLIAQLKNKKLDEDKKLMYLRLLIHLVGDVHQPLHVSKNGTSGGNNIKILWFDEPSNLHRLWDEHLIQYQQLSYTEYADAINYTTKKEKKQWQSDDMSKWLFESYQLSNQIHDEIKQPNEKISFAYNFKHIKDLNEQLLKGGVRLAHVLNQIFD